MSDLQMHRYSRLSDSGDDSDSENINEIQLSDSGDDDSSMEKPISISREMNQSDELALQKLEALNDQLQRNIKKLNSGFDKNHSTLINKVKELNDITDELESVHKATTVGSLVGSSMGAAGGIAALTGLALSFFTFGASLVVSGVGLAVGIAGGVTGAVCNITNMIKQTNLRQTIEEIINDFQNTINPMIEHLSAISNTIKELQQAYSVQNKVILTSVRSAKTLLSITKLLTVLKTAQIGKTAARAAKTLRMVGKLSGALSSLFIILDAYSIYCDATELSEMNNSAHTRKVDEIKSETLKFINQMRETAAEFQETLAEIKSAKVDINKALQIS